MLVSETLIKSSKSFWSCRIRNENFVSKPVVSIDYSLDLCAMCNPFHLTVRH